MGVCDSNVAVIDTIDEDRRVIVIISVLDVC